MSAKAIKSFLTARPNSTDALGESYYYLGRPYELENFSDIFTAFYKKAVEINPQSEAAKRLGGE